MLDSMRLTQAATLARHYMNKWNLTDWVFQYDRAKRRAGCCHHHLKTISLSEYYVGNPNNPPEDVVDTILHEIAHALAGFKAGHGYEWEQKCKLVGAKPERCYDSNKVTMPSGNFTAACRCGAPHKKYRLRKGYQWSCRRCGDKLNFQRV